MTNKTSNKATFEPLVFDDVRNGDDMGRIRFEMPAGRGRLARNVEQELRVRRVKLRDRRGGHVGLTCLIASEVNTPAGAKPVVWRLLSNREVCTLEQAAELVNWYRARWDAYFGDRDRPFRPS